MKYLIILLCLALATTTMAEEPKNTAFVSMSRVDGVSDVSFGLTKKIFTIFDFVEVSAMLQGDWTEDGMIGGSVLLTKKIKTFTYGLLAGVEIDAQWLPTEGTLSDKVRAYASYGVYTLGIPIGMEIGNFAGAPISVNILWYESFGFDKGTLYREGSSLYTNLSIGFSGII